MRAGFLEPGFPFCIDQRGCRIGKYAVWIGRGRIALRLDKDAPA